MGEEEAVAESDGGIDWRAVTKRFFNSSVKSQEHGFYLWLKPAAHHLN